MWLDLDSMQKITLKMTVLQIILTQAFRSSKCVANNTECELTNNRSENRKYI